MKSANFHAAKGKIRKADPGWETYIAGMKAPVPPALAQEDIGLTCVIGLTQFVFMALGIMVLTILVKVSTVSQEVTPLAGFLTTHHLWLVIIPLFWALLAAGLTQFGPIASRIANITGILLAILIGILFSVAILKPVG